MVLYENALESCKSDYYRAKWTPFPKIIRGENIFSVRFFFLENLMHKRTRYIQYDFDTISQEEIGFSRGFERIQS